jgi:hypothetical protein
VTSPLDLPAAAIRYALDDAAAVWDAARREESTAEGRRGPVRAPRLQPLEVAKHAVLAARSAIGEV